MKKLRLFLFAFFSIGLMLGANAQQDTIKHLIFSEHRGNGPYDWYMELANVGTNTIDLSKVTLAEVYNKTFIQDENGEWRITSGVSANKQKRFSGTLAPGETYLIMQVSDQYLVSNDPSFGPDHRLDLMPKADWINHARNAWGISEDTIPEWEMWGFDSVDVRGQMFWTWGSRPYVLFNHLDNGDSVLIDQFRLLLDANGKAGGSWTDVAGVEDATRYNTLVRKANVTTGNMVWANSKGVDDTDSEWIVLPNQDRLSRTSFTTVKNHGVFQLDVSSSVVDVDIPNSEMSVPWGVYKGDSILSLLDIGPGQTWEYIWDSSLVDSTHTIITDGDIFTIYTVGNEVLQTNFEITVANPLASEARVFPLRDKRYSDANPFPEGYWVQPFYVTKEEPVIDSIGDVPYATRVDTLFKYLEKAPGANWEIVWKDGVVRADLQNGDILKVTAEDGSTVKEYFIDVQDYAASDNINLSAITWPDKSEFLEGWNNDTIPQFNPNKTQYTVLVPYGLKNVPALIATPANINTKIEQKRAVSLTGSLEERTTVFSVTSESDTLSQDYKVTFEMEKDPSKVQFYKGDPFFSEMIMAMNSWNFFLEVVNPGDVELDLSEYLIVRTNSAINPGDAITSLEVLDPTDADFQHRYSGYVPGYKYHDDTTAWINEPGILSIDGNVDPVIEPGGAFVMAMSGVGRDQYVQEEHIPLIDKWWIGYPKHHTDLGVRVTSVPPYLVRGASALWLFHIENDAVLEGTKPVGDPADYRLVDVVGDPIDDGIWSIAGTEIDRNGVRIRMKPDVYQGSESLEESSDRFGTDDASSSWILDIWQDDYNHINGPDYIGSHVMDPVTAHLSTVTSSVYLVSDGYAGLQSIQGDLSSTSVDQFFANIDKADTAQVIAVHSATDGSVKTGDAAVAGTDTLVVTSANGQSVTNYVLTDQPLDSDAVLTTVDNSDLEIGVNGDIGTVSGVEYGDLLKDVISELKVPDLAVMNIINGDGELVPLSYLAYDSTKMETKVGADIFLEVIAQDQVTEITYSLEPAAAASDAFVVSSIYAVDQDNDLIEGLADGTSTSLFFKNIVVVEGATAQLYTKLGHVREDGHLAYDDVLQVVSEDGTVTRTYFITFLEETTPDANGAPEITLAFSDSTIAVPGTLMLSATANDDGLPPPANLTYTWEVTSDNAADVVIETPDALETNVTFNEKADYTLSLSVSDGALTSTADVAVTVGFVGVNNSIAPAINLYPNPAKSKLTIELANMPEQTSVVSFYNITGSIVYNGKLSEMTNEIDVSGFESGLYFIKIDSGNSSFTERIQIQN